METPRIEKNGLVWVRGWLDQGGYDFDGFVEPVSFFRGELPELDDYFEPENLESRYEKICAFKSGIQGLEKIIRDEVLKCEHELDGLDMLSHPAMSREDIGRLFTPMELEPVRKACNNWAKNEDEEELKIFHSQIVGVSLKLDWPEIQRYLSKNPLLSHVFWSILVDNKILRARTQEALGSFRKHLG